MGKGNKVLSVMSSKPMVEKKEAELIAKPLTKAANNADQEYDDNAEYWHYDQQLRNRLRDKNPSAFDNYMAEKSKVKLARLSEMREKMDIAQKTGMSVSNMMNPTFKDAKALSVPSSYKEKLDEAEMLETLGEKQYKRFQELRKRKGLAGIQDGILERSDFSTYDPQRDLNVEKALSRDDGQGNKYVGKFKPDPSIQKEKNKLTLLAVMSKK